MQWVRWETDGAQRPTHLTAGGAWLGSGALRGLGGPERIGATCRSCWQSSKAEFDDLPPNLIRSGFWSAHAAGMGGAEGACGVGVPSALPRLPFPDCVWVGLPSAFNRVPVVIAVASGWGTLNAGSFGLVCLSAGALGLVPGAV